MQTRNARVAGITFLLYYGTSLTDMWLFRRASSGDSVAERMATIAQHAPEVRLTVVLALLSVLCALILAVTLYALTREVDRDLALLAFACRLIEGALNAVPAAARLGLLSLATTAGVAAGEAGAARVEAEVLLNVSGWTGTVSGTVFAVGSTLFAYLFLRGRSIPAPLAWLGVLGSLIVVPVFPLRGLRLVSGGVVWGASLPLIVFELTLAAWLLVRGVTAPTGAQR